MLPGSEAGWGFFIGLGEGASSVHVGEANTPLLEPPYSHPFSGSIGLVQDMDGAKFPLFWARSSVAELGYRGLVPPLPGHSFC